MTNKSIESTQRNRKSKRKKSKNQKTCYFITPIGDESSDAREKADFLFERITPILGEMGFEFHVSHQEFQVGNINQQIIRRLINSDLVIANLTSRNPNVLYELGIRHTLGKPVIQIMERGEQLNFDIIAENTIFYTYDVREFDTFLAKLRSMLINLKFNEYTDNPVTRELQSLNALSLEPHVNTLELVLQRMEKIESYVIFRKEAQNLVSLISQTAVVEYPLLKQEDLEKVFSTIKNIHYVSKIIGQPTEKIYRIGVSFSPGTNADFITKTFESDLKLHSEFYGIVPFLNVSFVN